MLDFKCFPSERLVLLVTIFLLVLQQGQSQSMTTRSVEMKAVQKYKALALKNKDRDESASLYENIAGSPYYYDLEMPADLIFHNGAMIENIPLQVDLYAEEFVVTNEKGVKTYLDLDFYKEIRVTHLNGVDIYKRVYPDVPRKLFLVLYEDEMRTLVKIPSVQHIESSIVSTSGRETINKFDRKDRYELLEGDKVTELVFKKKKFFKAFSKETANYLKGKAKELNTAFKDESDYIQLVASLAGK